MKFKELKINQEFEFIHDPSWLCIAHGPWIKVSTRKYIHKEDINSDLPNIHKVGTINVDVKI